MAVDTVSPKYHERHLCWGSLLPTYSNLKPLGNFHYSFFYQDYRWNLQENMWKSLKGKIKIIFSCPSVHNWKEDVRQFHEIRRSLLVHIFRTISRIQFLEIIQRYHSTSAFQFVQCLLIWGILVLFALSFLCFLNEQAKEFMWDPSKLLTFILHFCLVWLDTSFASTSHTSMILFHRAHFFLLFLFYFPKKIFLNFPCQVFNRLLDKVCITAPHYVFFYSPKIFLRKWYGWWCWGINF